MFVVSCLLFVERRTVVGVWCKCVVCCMFIVTADFLVVVMCVLSWLYFTSLLCLPCFVCLLVGWFAGLVWFGLFVSLFL